MQAVFTLEALQCIAPKNGRDAVKIYFAVASDGGYGDKLESATEDSLKTSISEWICDLGPGENLDLAHFPPKSRSDWKTNALSFSEKNTLRWTLIGLGYHKPELGGGSSNVNSTLYKLAETLRETFLGLLGPVGNISEAFIDLAEDLADTSKDPNCLGALFSFSGEWRGADLAFLMFKNHGVRFALVPADSVLIDVKSGCTTPRYAAQLRISGNPRPTISEFEEIKFVYKGLEFVPRNVMQACVPRDSAKSIKIWIEKNKSVFVFTPSINFTELWYAWSINEKYLDPSEKIIVISVSVTKFVAEKSIETKTEKQNIALSYSIDLYGKLKIECSENSGNFSFDLQCRLKNPNGEELSIMNRTKNIESEFIEGNQAYQEYKHCVDSRWLRLRTEVVALEKNVPTGKIRDEIFGSPEVWSSFEEAMNLAVNLRSQIKRISIKSNR